MIFKITPRTCFTYNNFIFPLYCISIFNNYYLNLVPRDQIWINDGGWNRPWADGNYRIETLLSCGYSKSLSYQFDSFVTQFFERDAKHITCNSEFSF